MSARPAGSAQLGTGASAHDTLAGGDASPSDTSPSVVNLIGQTGQYGADGRIKTSQAGFLPDGQDGSNGSVVSNGPNGSTTPHDWTIHHAPSKKVQDPPPKPLYKILLEHIKSVWLASTGAIHIQNPVLDQANTANANANVTATPGVASDTALSSSSTGVTPVGQTQTLVGGSLPRNRLHSEQVTK